MFILGLQGSPRKTGNTNHLLETYLAAAAERGAVTAHSFSSENRGHHSS